MISSGLLANLLIKTVEAKPNIIVLFMSLVASIPSPTSASQFQFWTAFLLWHVSVNEDVCSLHKPKDIMPPNTDIDFSLYCSRKRRTWEGRSENAAALGRTISVISTQLLMQSILVVLSGFCYDLGVSVWMGAVRGTHRSNKTRTFIRSRAQP